jgi:hypothetical protein
MAVLRRNEKLHAWSAMGDIKQKLQENTSGVVAAIQPLYTKCFFFFAGKKNADFLSQKKYLFLFKHELSQGFSVNVPVGTNIQMQHYLYGNCHLYDVEKKQIGSFQKSSEITRDIPNASCKSTNEPCRMKPPTRGVDTKTSCPFTKCSDCT